MLLPGEGEGRNALYAASKGWEVDAFDQSSVAQEKALAFMKKEGVQINYQACDLVDFPFQINHYDLVGLIFFHAGPRERKLMHQRVVESLKPGGMVILEAFHTSQLGNSTGGPQDITMLYDEEILRKDFFSLKQEVYENIVVELDEGLFHQGKASLVRYTGIKESKI